MLGQAERLIELKSLFNKKEKDLSDSAILSFISGKGGTGKTFLSLNISHVLAGMGKKVLYVDFDFNLANAHLLLDINPAKTLFDFFSSRALLNEVIFQYNENFHLIFGDSGRSDFTDIDDAQMNRFLNQLKSSGYDFIILDFPAGVGKSLINTLSYTDYAIMVATTDPTAVMDAYALTKLMKHEKLQCSKYVIINKSRSIDEGGIAFNNLNSASRHFLKENLELLSCISLSNEAYDSVYSQKLAAENYENSPVLTEIKAAAKRISEITHLANIHQPA
ncbi:MAG: AAA family ATPase [Ignavibacteriaceae bacterium]